jgi:hypothetical protein
MLPEIAAVLTAVAFAVMLFFWGTRPARPAVREERLSAESAAG